MKKLLLLLLLLTSCDKIDEIIKPDKTDRKIPVAGYDVLGVAKYCDTFLAAPPLPAVSTVLEIFGDPMPCIEQYIKKNSKLVTDVQIDLVDATCHRNKVCPPGTPALNNLAVMKQRAERIHVYAKTYPKITWWISPYLEHDIKNANELKAAFDVAQAACPICRLINSPVSGISLSSVLEERHGTKNVRAFSVSGDGASMFDADNIKDDGNDFQHRLAGTDQIYGWVNSFNLRCTGEKKFVAIKDRTHRPHPDEFLQIEKILKTEEPPKPTPPAICKTTRDIQGSKGEITKTNAELYCNGTGDDGRGNKPLLIIEKKGGYGERMTIHKPDGTEVGCFRYHGEFLDKRLGRWYVGNCSGERPYQLYQEIGGEWAHAKDKNGNCIRFNVIRRQGNYR